MHELTRPLRDIFETGNPQFKIPRRRRRNNTDMGLSGTPDTSGDRKRLHTLKHVSDKKDTGKQARQRLFLDAYVKNLFSVAKAVRAVGISRSVYYHWRANDQEFMDRLNDAVETKKDFVEHALMSKVANGDIAAVIFCAKCLLSDRGYRPDSGLLKLDVKHSGNSKLNLSKEERDAVVAASQISPESAGFDLTKLRGTGKHKQPH
jgi:hypothetical protein